MGPTTRSAVDYTKRGDIMSPNLLRPGMERDYEV